MALKLPSPLAGLFKKRDVPTPPQGQLGRVGSARGYVPVSNEKTPFLAPRLDNVSLDDLDKLRHDPVIRYALRLWKLPLLRAEHTIECENESIKAFLAKAIEPTLHQFLWNALNALDFGFSCQEMVWGEKAITVSDPSQPAAAQTTYPRAWVIDKWAHLDPTYSWLMVYPNGDFASVKQYLAFGGSDKSDIPAEKCVLIALDAEFNEVYGTPLTKAALPYYEQKLYLLENLMIYLRKRSVGVMKGFAPPGMTETGTDSDGNPQGKSNVDYLNDVLDALKSGDAISFPALFDQSGNRLWDAESFDMGTETEFLDKWQAYNKEIQLALCVPELMNQSSEHGTQSLGTKQIDSFTDNLYGLARQLEDAASNQYLRRMIDYNFGKSAPDARLNLKIDRSYVETLVSSAIQQLGSGQPVTTASGDALTLDWEKIAQDADLPTQKMDRDSYQQLYGMNESDQEGGDHQGRFGGDQKGNTSE